MNETKTPIKEHRLYNKAQIARAVGKSRSYVSRVMRGKTENPAVLKKIKEIINTPKAA
ncbi:MAG: hypothetical protein Kow0098_03210 [Ignavibacteriaceae bacterium]